MEIDSPSEEESGEESENDNQGVEIKPQRDENEPAPSKHIPCKYPFSKFIPKDSHDYYEKHLANDVFIDQMLNNLLVSMNKASILPFLKSFEPFLQARIKSSFKEGQLEYKSLFSSLEDCRAKITLFESLLPPGLDVRSLLYREGSDALPLIQSILEVLKRNLNNIVGLEGFRKVLKDSLANYFLLRMDFIKGMDAPFRELDSYKLELEFASANWNVIWNFIRRIDMLLASADVSLTHKIDLLPNARKNLFDISQPVVADFLEQLVTLTYAVNPLLAPSQAPKLLKHFDSIYSLGTDNRPLYRFLRAKALLFSSNIVTVRKLKDVLLNLDPKRISFSLSEYVSNYHTFKEEHIEALSEFIECGLEANMADPSPTFLKLLKLFLKERKAVNLLKTSPGDLKFYCYSKLLDYAAYPYSKPLLQETKNKITNLINQDHKSEAGPLIKQLGTFSKCSFSFERKIAVLNFAFHICYENAIADPEKSPAWYLLGYLRALIAKHQFFFDLDPKSGLDIFEVAPDNVSDKDPHFQNNTKTFNALRIFADKLRTTVSFLETKEKKFADYKNLLENKIIEEKYRNTVGEFLKKQVIKDLDLGKISEIKFLELKSENVTAFHLNDPYELVLSLSTHFSPFSPTDTKNIDLVFDAFVKSLAQNIISEKHILEIRKLSKDVPRDGNEISMMKSNLVELSLVVSQLESWRKTLKLVKKGKSFILVISQPPISKSPETLFLWKYYIKPRFEGILQKAIYLEQEDDVRKYFDDHVKELLKNSFMDSFNEKATKYFLAAAFHKVFGILEPFIGI